MLASKTQIDKLGQRLKTGEIGPNDLRELEAYRISFSDAYERVLESIRLELCLQPTGRSKSTPSIALKLRRESIRLSQIQDIAGCRLIVLDITNQDETVKQLETLFGSVTIVDRRQQPSNGYRAVHVIVEMFGRYVEIQVRTQLQHLWAEMSEKLSDILGPSIKYGGGDSEVARTLLLWSAAVSSHEKNAADPAYRSMGFISQSRQTIADGLQGLILDVNKLTGKSE